MRSLPRQAATALALAIVLAACGTGTWAGHATSVDSPIAYQPAATSHVQRDSSPRLSRGAHGPEVRRLQEQLTALGYWLGPVDGRFGDATQQAVYALQKVAGISRDGVVGPRTWRALRHRVVPTPRSIAGTRAEIDLQRDLIMFVGKGQLRYVINTSTGGGYTYVSRGVTGVAVTPAGRFRVNGQVAGLQISPLGELWWPKYFHGGYAIHGSASVPPYPASHGCVRVSIEAIRWIWSKGLLPIGMKVWIYR